MVETKTISSAPCLNFLKVKQLPAIAEPNAVYYVKDNNDTTVKAYLTDINGNPTLIGGTASIVSNFTNLTDTPNTYVGQANKFVTVRTDQSGLEFTTFPNYNVPSTFIRIDLSDEEEEVAITWMDYEPVHGTRPIYIDVYEITPNSFFQSTSKVYTEDNGLTYKWYVGVASSRKWEIRIMGHTLEPLPIFPITSNNSFPYTFPFTFS